ncbi:indolepyruvate ferredoxin oxidoreductase family protein [Pseudomaricurvus alkylphenolicus]|uniref:indolepyruvate ferredoxin oxidoreductase family protein n=1 Tax=Pseudomaricurvus alkylphenolicus TaxID=1306991 RepID=UPI0014248866|nr:indolepyruvate ferredoxin oxidoreductase family protein [Pseudomaricurvus alkylphenolicus]
MKLAQVSLEDKYEVQSGRIYLTGSQALVRLAFMLKQRDEAIGLNTAGFISGYRGSPMHAIDTSLWQVPELLEQHDIKFVPGVNEDLAATAVRGTQMAGIYGDGEKDGVFAFWYAKGPGLDRSLDALRHANLCGTSPKGGVLALTGDDHGMRSTDTPAHCEPTYEDLMMPLLYPANVQEVLDFGILGIELSRFSGAWVGFKMVFETVDTSVSVDVDPQRVQVVTPEFDMPEGGLHTRMRDWPLFQEERLRRYKLPAAIAFARANQLNRVSHHSRQPRYGIVAAGKAWLDVLEALRELGINDDLMEELGIVVYKVGMVYPHDLEGYRDFGRGLDEVLVVEEKREHIERAVKDACFDLPQDVRPRVVGRADEAGELLINELGELTPEVVAQAIAKRIAYFHTSEKIDARIGFLQSQCQHLAQLPAVNITRMPYFCSGCPHNTSTNVPEGSRAHGGVGCHGMAMYMNRGVVDWTHMGGEGMTWIGESPYVKADHVFQDLGDGTYFHSGSLAIRQAVAAGVNITYKILYNDAVAMTGGQPVDGSISVPEITHQAQGEGVKKIVVVTDEPEKYQRDKYEPFASGVEVFHRRELDRVQKELREVKGVSVMIYDQTCAAEKRRRRKRGTFPDPAKRAFINDRVCEGCGDCSVKSNCLSVLPLKTEYGNKRTIDQSSCNKDFSCVEGFCPSFVTVLGGRPRKGKGVGSVPAGLESLPNPVLPSIPHQGTYNILVNGVGGTGVVTIGALLGMAAHLEGKGASIVDQLGMAQKGGAVTTHIRFGNTPDDIKAVRVNAGNADLLLGCDSLVAGTDVALKAARRGHTYALINTNEAITGDFTQNPDLKFPANTLEARVLDVVGSERTDLLNATRLATRLLGDSIASNLFMVGYAWQKGLLPISAAAISRAIELNGVAVEWNQQAFAWGRRAAHNLEAVIELAEPAAPVKLLETAAAIAQRRAADLVEYQDAAYAERYRKLVAQVEEAEKKAGAGLNGLAEAVAENAYKLMAYKDEYEVARLYSDPEFLRKLEDQFEGDYKLQFNLAPPLLARPDKRTGVVRKMQFGPWMMKAFGVLKHLKRLRGSALDPFGYTAERRQERALVIEYEQQILAILQKLSPTNHARAIEIARLPECIRGYGHVKERHMAEFRQRQSELLRKWRIGDSVLEAVQFHQA